MLVVVVTLISPQNVGVKQKLFQIEALPVVSETADKKGKKSSMKLGPARTLWEAKPIVEGAEKYYFFSDFVASLNEMEAGVAPTDTRLRPDQREGESQKANTTDAQISAHKVA